MKDWYLGFDIGTNSVGWCATDTEYNILTKGKKLQCGARLFKDAQDASKRRGFRSGRRRMDRRKVRIDLLQELFDSEIAKIDPSFFIRLNESAIQIDDRDNIDSQTRDLYDNTFKRRGEKQVKVKSAIQIDDRDNIDSQTRDLYDNTFKKRGKKQVKVKYPLFLDKDFTDEDYFKKFPTIYHLKQHLLQNDTKDPRLLYLACVHTIKYRGHFLAAEFNTKRGKEGYSQILEQINDSLKENCWCNNTKDESCIVFETQDIDKFIADTIKGKELSEPKQNDEIRQRLNPNDEIRQRLNPKGDKILKALIDAMQGGKIRLSKVFKEQASQDGLNGKTQLQQAESAELKEFEFGSEKYDECLAYAETILTDKQLGLISLLKQFHDIVRLNRIMAGADCISQAMVNIYDAHKADLELLKGFVKKYCDKYEYDKMFRSNTEKRDKDFIHASYVNYIGTNMTGNKKTISHFVSCVNKKDQTSDPMTATHKDFLKYTEALLERVASKSEDAKNSKEYQELKKKIGLGDLCKVLNTVDNSYIPHQLNEAELKEMLKRQSDNFEFLSNEDEFGIVADKIVKLLTFRIPYYVGPLSDRHKDTTNRNQRGNEFGNGKFAWIEKNAGFENTRVLPWNFEKVVNLASSGEQFIARMTSKCTYLRSEDVIPGTSLLYQDYRVLQDLNNLKINGNRISQDLKEFLYNGICQTESSLSKKKIKDYLLKHGKIAPSDTVGKEDANDAKFDSSLSSHIKFKNILGDNYDKAMAEQIIKWHTVFGNEKKPVIDRIKQEYSNVLTQDDIDKLGKLNFKAWAAFSQKFLEGVTATDKTTGEMGLSIIACLRNTTLNLMEILNSDRYEPKFLDAVKAYNGDKGEFKFDYDSLVKDLYCSPTVKRSIWQSLLIAKELQKINGTAPKKVFIEVTRVEDKQKKGKKTTSRREQIAELLKSAAKTGLDLTQMQQEFDKKTTDTEFRSDRLYLYFTQLGKCMYTGEKINLADLNNNNLYDIDHIYPQSLLKDDSLSNRVLVTRQANAEKGDRYPLPESLRAKMTSWWDRLLNAGGKGKEGLISRKKYDRLIGSKRLTDEQLAGFVNRQLVSTNQAVKETINALDAIFNQGCDNDNKNTKMVFSKAGNVSEFRAKFDLIKCRQVNNLHHGHDAYLNIVVGNVWDSVYSKYWQNNNTFNENRALDKLFTKDKEGIWQKSYIQKIKDYVLNYADKYLDKFVVTKKPYQVKGEFYDQTIYPKGNKNGIPLKDKLDTLKYGCYTSDITAFNCAIEYDGKTTQEFEFNADFVAKFKNSKGKLDKQAFALELVKDKGINVTDAPVLKKIDENTGKCKIEHDCRHIGVFGVPIRYVAKYKNDDGKLNRQVLANQIAKDLGIEDKRPLIKIESIKMFSVLEIDGTRYHMRSKDLQCSVVAEWYPSSEIVKIIKEIVKYQALVSEKQISNEDIKKHSETDGEIIFATREKNPHNQESKSLTKDKNLKAFDAIIKQIKKPFYQKYSFANKVAKGEIDRAKFEQLKTAEQANQIIELLNMITMNGTLTNASKIGGAANEVCKYVVGDSVTSPISTKHKKVFVVNQSVTGLFENKIAVVDN